MNKFFFISLFVFAYSFLYAEYNNDNPIIVSDNTFEQSGIIKMVALDDGKNFIAWQEIDYNNGRTSTYLQLLDKNGNFLWDKKGVFIKETINSQVNFEEDLNLMITKKGEAIISTTELNDGNIRSISFYKISQNKEFLWGKSGKQIFSDEEKISFNQVAVHQTAEGNIFICATSSGKAFLQAINDNGESLFEETKTIEENITDVQILSSISNRFFLTYKINKALYVDIYDDKGVIQEKAIYVGNESGEKLNPMEKYYAFSDGNGGIIIVWENMFEGRKSVFVQRINEDGERLFDADGVNLASGEADCSSPIADVDIKNKIIYVAFAKSELNKKNVYLKRLDFDGNTVGEMELSEKVDYEIDNKPIAIVHIPNGRAIIVMKIKKSFSQDYNIVAVRADENNAIFWEKSIYGGEFSSVCATHFHMHQIVLAWCGKYDAGKAIKAQNITYNGILGVDDGSIETDLNLMKGALIYPNPTNNFANILITSKLPHFTTINIYDVNGICVVKNLQNYLNSGKNEVKINVSNLPSGFYQVFIDTDNYEYNYRFIKQ